MRFTKMQGLGNDYVYLDCTQGMPPDPPKLARTMSDRHFGVGSDGLICIRRSERADFRMSMYNADGSEGEMCGNGIRCLGKFVYDRGLTDKTELTVETLAGVKRLSLHGKDGAVDSLSVDMGAPILDLERIPVTGSGDRFVSRRLTVQGRAWEVTCLSMGNPHAVLFVEDLSRVDVPSLGPAVERHAVFPNHVNAEFVQVLGRDRLRMRVWERGTGETLACGTGACAALCAGVLTDRTGRRADVELPGGTLSIRWEEADGHVYMTGPAVTVFQGEWPEA